MEEPRPSKNSSRNDGIELALPRGDALLPHPPRPVDPRAVEAHFAPLLDRAGRPSAEQRLAAKVDVPFRW